MFLPLVVVRETDNRTMVSPLIDVAQGLDGTSDECWLLFLGRRCDALAEVRGNEQPSSSSPSSWKYDATYHPQTRPSFAFSQHLVHAITATDRHDA
jgi:hypothetical protein